MQPHTAVVLGATGLTGRYLVPLLLNDNSFSAVRVLTRRPLEITHTKLQIEITDFSNLTEYRNKLGTGNTIFCCIGTTQRKVNGSRASYRKIDIDIPYHAAQMGIDAGFKNYLIVSAAGANSHSANFYLKIKGEVEAEIAKLSYEKFHVFRPSLVLGDREEFRLKEIIARNIMKIIDPLLFGTAKKYRSMQAKNIAAAMVAASGEPMHGMVIHHYTDMMRLAQTISI